MPPTQVDKRNFYLTLSIVEGQKLASTAGFAVPSPEVQEHEIMDTISKWVVLTSLGIFDTVQHCAGWMTEIVKIHNDLDDDEAESTKSVIQSFGMALISHLVDNDLLLLPENVTAVSNPTTDGKTIFNLLTFVVSDEDEETDYDEYLEEEDDDE